MYVASVFPPISERLEHVVHLLQEEVGVVGGEDERRAEPDKKAVGFSHHDVLRDTRNTVPAIFLVASLL